MLLNTANGKIYVGQSQNVKERIRVHAAKKKTPRTYIGKAIHKYGWGVFEVWVLEQIDDLSKLNEREQYWIDALNVCDSKVGYNLCPIAGSSRGIKLSDEVRAIFSAAHMGIKVSEEAKAKIKVASTGRLHRPEAKAKVSAAQRGRQRTEHERYLQSISHMGQNAKSVLQLDIETSEVIKQWRGAKDVQRELGIHSTTICKCCKGHNATAGGFKWRYANEEKI
jgi:group I intron endonuclease